MLDGTLRNPEMVFLVTGGHLVSWHYGDWDGRWRASIFQWTSTQSNEDDSRQLATQTEEPSQSKSFNNLPFSLFMRHEVTLFQSVVHFLIVSLFPFRSRHFSRASWTDCLFETLLRGPRLRSCSSTHFSRNLALPLVSCLLWGKTAWDEHQGDTFHQVLCLSQSTEHLRQEDCRKVQLCTIHVSDQVFERSRLSYKYYKHYCWLELRPLEKD